MNHFVKLELTDGGTLTVRPEHIAGVMEFPDEDYAAVMLTSGARYQIPKGQISLDCLINHTQHAGVRVLG